MCATFFFLVLFKVYSLFLKFLCSLYINMLYTAKRGNSNYMANWQCAHWKLFDGNFYIPMGSFLTGFFCALLSVVVSVVVDAGSVTVVSVAGDVFISSDILIMHSNFLASLEYGFSK